MIESQAVLMVSSSLQRENWKYRQYLWLDNVEWQKIMTLSVGDFINTANDTGYLVYLQSYDRKNMDDTEIIYAMAS